MNRPVKRCCALWIASLSLTGAFASPAAAAAAAADTTRTRQVYYAPGPNVPGLANAYLRLHLGEALEIVTISQPGKETTQSYYAFTVPARSAAGVCRFTANQLYPHEAGDQITWNTTPLRPGERREPTATLASVAEGVAAEAPPCPPSSQEAYTSLHGKISDENFIEVAAFWKEISTSAEAFERVSTYLPFILAPPIADKFTEFKSELFSAGREPPKIRAMFSDTPDTYDFVFLQAGTESPKAFLTVSKSDAGFQVLNFQTPY